MPSLKVNGAIPVAWEALPPQKTALYTHSQWRAPSTHTGVGVAHVRMPLPLGADAVLWLAKKEYAKRSDDGKAMAQWTDEFGRKWFEAQNKRYHVRGYALAQGFDAWIVYFGYRLDRPPHPTEISLAARCADTFVPLVGGAKAAAASPATQPTTQPATQPVSAAEPVAAGGK
jgi:hypothetical protein